MAGDWNGAILLECDRRQACQFAGRFLSLDPSDTVDDVVRDVLGELVNMIGGNMKCVLTRVSGFPCPRWWMEATTACAYAGLRFASGSLASAPRGHFGSRSWPCDPETPKPDQLDQART